METPKSDSKLSSASEYALIFGAGATAAMSLAAQQIAAASVPVTALVAIGLLNRRRLDQQIKEGTPLHNTLEERAARYAETPQRQVSSQPTPESLSVQPRPVSPNPNRPAVSFSRRRTVDDEAVLAASQQASLKQIGAYLQQVRQEKSLTLQDIHQKTYIQRYALQAIEVGDLATLPEPFYIRAFIQKYAIALGLSGAEIASQFPVA